MIYTTALVFNGRAIQLTRLGFALLSGLVEMAATSGYTRRPRVEQSKQCRNVLIPPVNTPGSTLLSPGA